ALRPNRNRIAPGPARLWPYGGGRGSFSARAGAGAGVHRGGNDHRLTWPVRREAALQTPGRPPRRGVAPPGGGTLPPRPASTAWPAATSHSQVGERRG